jgi:hypothetical protein
VAVVCRCGLHHFVGPLESRWERNLDLTSRAKPENI